MKESELIKMQRQIKLHNVLMETFHVQLNQLDKLLTITIETLKRMEGYDAANLKLEADLTEAQEQSEKEKEDERIS